MPSHLCDLRRTGECNIHGNVYAQNAQNGSGPKTGFWPRMILGQNVAQNIMGRSGLFRANAFRGVAKSNED